MANRTIAMQLCPPTLIFAGDSQIADGFQGGGNGTTFNTRIPYWILQQTRKRFICDMDKHVFATSGATTTSWISTHLANCVAAVTAAVALGSQPLVFFKLGINDCGNTFTYATSKGNFDTIFAALTAAGAICCPITITPKGSGAALSANQEKLRNALNSYFMSFHFTPSKRIVPVSTLKAMTNGDGLPRAGYLTDNLHPTVVGAEQEALVVSAFLNAYYPANIYPDFNFAADVYDATYNPNGNRLANGALTGTTGTLAGGVTGNAPTSCTVGVYTSASLTTVDASTASAVGSQVTSSLDIPNEPMYQLVLGGTAGAKYYGLLRTAIQSGAGFVPGDIIQMGMDVEWDAGLAGIVSIGINFDLWFQGAAKEGYSGNGVDTLPSSAHRVSLISHPVTVPVGYSNTNILDRIAVQTSASVAPSGTIRFGQQWVRKVG